MVFTPHFQLIKVFLPTPIMEIISQEVCILAYELLPVFFSLQTVQISIRKHAFVLQDATQLVGEMSGLTMNIMAFFSASSLL